jgi:glyoxylase-like metal-dependent hydrolase (beta-lactamase superfamily II)/rhodanese-related sulfurtransferase
MARDVDAQTLYQAVFDGLVPELVDLRNPEEVAAQPLELPRPAPVRQIALWHLLDDPQGFATQIPTGAVLVCAHGNGAAMVADELAEHGLTVASLTGGLQAWSELLVSREVSLTDSPVRCWQLLRPAKGCLSYLIGVPGHDCLVVDPARHLSAYLALAAEHGMTISHVIDTHLHADHISGGPALAAQVGARYSLPAADSGTVPWPTTALDDGAQLQLGSGAAAEVLALHLPGHTPGTTAVSVRDVLVAVGDTIFVRGVGRPDLTGQAESLARQLFASVRERLGALSPDTVLLPAHWSSSAEIGQDGTVRTTLGAVLAADLLAGLDATEFVERVLASLPAAPASYDRMRAINAGASATAEEQQELELGRNQCAAAGTVQG